MKNVILGLGMLVLLSVSNLVHATTEWNAQDYDLYAGDFDGDGKTDILYIAKDPSMPSGIARSDGTGPNIAWQSWASNYLGINWSGNQYNVIVADFNGDGKADIFLQSVGPGNSYLLLTSPNGLVVGISQTIANGAMGLTWSADQHHIVAGDFNGDHQADLFLQATSPTGTNAVVLSGSGGLFVSASPTQTWSDGYLGFKWSTVNANVFAGDFNGDGRADLLIQAKPNMVMIDYDVPFPVPTYPPNMNGVVLSQGGTTPFTAVGAQAWSRMNNGVDWSPLTNNIVIATDGSGKSEVILQARNSTGTSYELTGNATGAIFPSTATALSSNVSLSASNTRLIAANFGGGKAQGQVGLFFQALTSTGTNYTTTAIGATITATTENPATVTGTVEPTSAGRTQGKFTVAATGNATYTVPIAVPPGARGIQPQLSLNYISGGNDGPMGPGWALSGVSTISRCNKSWASNGAPSGVTLATSDDLCLDGNRLRLISGGQGMGGSTYQTELANFSFVQANGSAGSPLTSFTVKAKDGRYYEYGASGNSNISASGSSVPYIWAIDKVTDRQGNVMTYAYVAGATSVTLSTIQYTATPGSSSGYGYQLSLNYLSRVGGSSIYKYVAGGLVTRTTQLMNIQILSLLPTSTLVRQYNLGYGASPTTNRPLLNSVQECAGSIGADCNRPTTFSYQTGATGWNPTAVTTGITGQYGYIPIDLNGDGIPDALYGKVTGSTVTWYARIATGINTFGSEIATGATTTPGTGLTYAAGIIPGAFSGNGKIQFLAPLSGNWYVYSYTGTGSNGTFTSANTHVPIGVEQMAIDYDGDGLPDLVAANVGFTGNVTIRQNITTVGGAVTFATTPQTVGSGLVYAIKNNIGAGAITPADFNNDGKADLIIGYQGTGKGGHMTWTVLLSNGFGPAPTAVTLPDGALVSSVAIGDWNGDGCTDVISPSTIWISNCVGGFTEVTTGVTVTSTTQYLPVDWDGDGQTDLLYTDATSNTWYVMRSTGNGIAAAVSTGIAAPNTKAFFGIDQDADGQVDIGYVDSANGYAVSYYGHNSAASPPDYLSAAVDGWGISAFPTYVPITQNNYTNQHDATFPDMDFQGPLYVVNNVSISDGTGGTFSNSLWYSGAHVNTQGRGFEGFNFTKSIDSRNNLVRYTYYLRTFPYIGGVYQDDIYQPNGTSLISHTANSFTFKPLVGIDCSVRCFPYVASVTTNTYDITTGSPPISTIAKSTTFDSYGNQTQIQTTTTDNNPSSPFYNQTWISLITNTVTPDTTNWCLNLPTTTTTQDTVPSQASQTRRIDHQVDYPNCRYTQETLQLGDARLQVTTNLGYDACGNPNSVSVIGLDSTGNPMAARTTSSSYGTRCTFPEQVTNPLSQTVQTSYRYDLGVKSSTTDANGVSVSWLYDDFGRKTQELRPEGTTTVWAYTDCVADSCWGSSDVRLLVTESLKDSSGNLIRTHEQFSDGLDRVRFDESNRVLGVWTTTVTQYDSLGRKSIIYLPYSSASNGYHQIGYDILNRPTSDQLHDSTGALNRQTTLTYAGLMTTLTDAKLNATSKYTDVTGKLRRIVDPSPGGTTNYTYDPFGNLISVTDAIGATITNVYNIRGFKTATNDPDAGSSTFLPDSLNELISQTDAKGATATFGYDLLGRITSRIEPESTTAIQWTYGTSAALHNIGRLQSVAKPDGYRESYTYDSLGRPQTIVYIEDTSYQVDYAYNALGSLDTLTYPTSTTGYRFAVKYLYSYGYLQSVQDSAAGTVFWSLSAANDSSLPTTEVLGNGVQVISSYTPWTNELVTRSEGVGSSMNGLQNLSYVWDLNGNLQQRVDLRQNLTEAFSNDSMNRLTNSTLNGVSNLTVQYDPSGNITSKSDFGTGTYNYTATQTGCSYYPNAQPHAVRNAGGNAYCYDANGNVTSRAGNAISWYSYNQPNTIQYGSNSTQFFYNANHQRWKQTANFAGTVESTYYAGGILEKLVRSTVTEYRHLVPIGSGSAIYTRRTDGSSGSYYVTTDHLGSGDLVLDSAANVLARESFTPFGARRGSNWQGNPTSGDYTAFDATTRRGFTGHEMLDGVSLIHMNGRVYDPYLGRFLSVDPIVQTTALSQALNPFSYVINNPLTLIDPTGYSWLSSLFHAIGSFFSHYWRDIVAIIIAIVAYYYLAPYLSTVLTPAESTAAGTVTVEASTVTVDGAVLDIPAASAFLGGGVTTIGAAVAGGIAGAISGGILGGWHGALIGAESGALFGAVGGYYGNSYGVGRVVATGVAGGVSSSLSGGGFWRGAEFGAGIALVQWAGYSMRQQQIEQSEKDSLNVSGDSSGLNDDTKLAGGRWVSGQTFDPTKSDPWKNAEQPFGGAQGGPGTIFGIGYSPGGVVDRILEEFAGPHDWLSQLQYTSTGDLGSWWGSTFFGQAAGDLYGAVALVPATVFVGASVDPELVYVRPSR